MAAKRDQEWGVVELFCRLCRARGRWQSLGRLTGHHDADAWYPTVWARIGRKAHQRRLQAIRQEADVVAVGPPSGPRGRILRLVVPRTDPFSLNCPRCGPRRTTTRAELSKDAQKHAAAGHRYILI